MDIGQVMSEGSRAVSQASQDMKSQMSPNNLNDPGKMLQTQFAMQQYSNFIGFYSGIIKAFKDMFSGIFSKI